MTAVTSRQQSSHSFPITRSPSSPCYYNRHLYYLIASNSFLHLPSLLLYPIPHITTIPKHTTQTANMFRPTASRMAAATRPMARPQTLVRFPGDYPYSHIIRIYLTLPTEPSRYPSTCCPTQAICFPRTVSTIRRPSTSDQRRR